MRPAEVVMYIT